MFKRLTILDEDYIATESAAVGAIKDAQEAIYKAVNPYMDIACSPTDEIRFCPAYLQIKSELRPVESINTILQAIDSAVMAKRRNYSLSAAAKMSEIYNYIYKIDTSSIGAAEEAIGIFGGSENVSFNLTDFSVELSENGVLFFRNKLAGFRELASAIPSELNSATNSNDIAGTASILQRLVLLKEFVKIL